jgi:tetratricopeptide (TPR) repeat protein
MPRAFTRLCWLAAALAIGSGEARAQPSGSLALAPTRGDAALEPLALGFDRWLAAELDRAGVTGAAVAPAGDLEATLAGAAAAGFSHLLLPQLSSRDGEAAVHLLLFAPDTRVLLVGTREVAPTAELGGAAADALMRLVPQLGAPAVEITPPLLEDLSSASQAMRARLAGNLTEAYRAVQGKLSPTSMRLREEIVEEAHRSGTPAVTRARVLAAMGDAVSAWTLIGRAARAALQEASPDPELLVAAGEVMLAQEAAAEAQKYLTRALEVAPGHVDATAGLAHAKELQGEVDTARAMLARAAQLDPSSPRLPERLARMDPDPARAAAQWIEAGRRSAVWLDAQRARTHFEKAVSLDGAAAPHADAEVGALEERLGRPADARIAYRAAVQGGVRTPVVLTALGRTEHRLGDSAAAERALRDAIALEPQHPGALRELGVVYTDTDRAAEALPLLREAHRLAPDDTHTRITLSRALRVTGDADEALALLTAADAAPSAEALREVAAIELQKGRAAAARAALEQAVALEPGDPETRARLSVVLAKTGDAGSAEAERQLAAALDPDHAPAEGDEPAEPDRAIASVLSLDDLVMSFAGQLANPEQRRVASLGVREPGDWRTLLLRLVRPRSPDLDAIDRGLRAAIAARFQAADPNEEVDDALSLHIDRLYDFEHDHSLDAATIATLNQVLAVDGVFVIRLIVHPEEAAAGKCAPGTFPVEMRLLLGREAEMASILSNTDCLDGGLESYGRWNAVAMVLYALLALLAAWPVIRGWGQIVVRIELPERTQGFFSIHVTRRPDKVKREVVDEQTQREKSRGNRLDFLRRYTRHMAGAETVFRLIPALKHPYTVTVSGPLKDARGEEIIGHFLEEQRVSVRRRRATTLVFDFRPKEVAVEVSVKENGRPARQARVSVHGDPSSLRYARDGVAYLYLGLGSYTILVGSGDAAASFEIEIGSLARAIPLQVDMGQKEGLVFSGCAAAVDPYLQSDLATAARALDAAGNARAAHLLRAELYRGQGRGDEAARELEAAGRLGDAAALRTRGSDFEGGAALYEEAGEIDRAAAAYRDAGAFAEAARCYEQVYDYGNALECWREVGDAEREMLMLEKLGEFMEAAAIARQRGERDRVIAYLQHIEPRHAQFGDACRLLAEIASEDGDHDLAVAKFEESLSATGIENASIETLESYAAVLERAGRKREALSAYEAIRRQDVARADIATRIQALKRELAETEAPTQRVAPTPRPAPESRYELLEEIGRGGMGVVFKARDRRLGRIVALKRLPENLRDHPAAVDLFEREARAAAALNHVNIVTLFDAGEEDGSFFITMELLEGRTLAAILERSGRVSVRDTMRLAIQMCAGLNYAHERKIVHRDIKTANLFFTNDQVVKIMDFGIAKSLQEVRRQTTVVGGTPFYMAPEQAAGEDVDHRADLYALGVTLFVLLTGQLPFEGGDVTYRHRHEEPPDPRELNLHIPADLARLVLHLMQKQPERRPSKAAAVAAALEALLAQPG